MRYSEEKKRAGSPRRPVHRFFHHREEKEGKEKKARRRAACVREQSLLGEKKRKKGADIEGFSPFTKGKGRTDDDVALVRKKGREGKTAETFDSKKKDI